MLDQQQEIKQDYHYQVDQQVSVNAYFDVEIAGEGVRFQITSRHGSTPEKIVRNVKTAIAAYEMLRQDYPRNVVQPPAPQEPHYESIDDSGQETPASKTFVADKLNVDMHNGKFYFKVIGAPWTQYGVTVWPEVLEQAKVQVDFNSVPPRVPSIAGWKAEYVMKEHNGKMVPDKVTKLSPI